MASELHLTARGLYTDPNQYELPEGALSVARNVVLRRAGVVEPRPGFKEHTFYYTQDVPERLFPYDGTYFAATHDGSTWKLKKADNTEVTDESSVSVDFQSRERIDHAEAAGNLYITANHATRRLSSGSASTAYKAGLPPALQGSASVVVESNEWFTDSEAVAYRTLFKRDINGRTLRSRPSGRFTRDGGDSGGSYIDVTVPLHSEAEAGDVIEVYRSKTVSGGRLDTSDELFLTLSHELTSSDISAGTVTLHDRTEAAELGASLYTNATQEGILQQNTRPPAARTLATHQGMMFYGDCKQPPAAIVRFAQNASNRGAWGLRIVSGDIQGTSVANLTWNNGNAVDLNADGFQTTQYIVDRAAGPEAAGTYIPSLTKIDSIDSATSLTLTKDTGTTQTNITMYVFDWFAVDFDGTRMYGSDTTSFSERTVKAALREDDVGDFADDSIEVVERIAHTINREGTYRAFGGADAAGRGVLSVENDDPSDASIELNGTKGTGIVDTDLSSLWAPEIDPEGNGTLTADDEDRQNRLYYSKLDRPDAVPRGVNFVDIGSPTKPIMGLASLRDALLIFKADGVWRLTGRSPGALRVDPLDSTLTLVHPEALDTLGPRAVAWTNRGVVAVSANGATRLSDPKIESDLADVQGAMLDQIRYDTGSDPDLNGLWLVADDDKDEFYVGVPGEATDGYTATIYVFNNKTGAWTTWDVPRRFDALRTAALSPVLGWLLLGGQAGPFWEVMRSREDTTVAGRTTCDDDRTTTVDTFAGTGQEHTVTISEGYVVSPSSFDDSVWEPNSSATSVTANSDTAPDGTETADTVDDTDSGAAEYRVQTVAVEDDSKERGFALYVKKTSGHSHYLGMSIQYVSNSTKSGTIVVNTNNGTVSNSGANVTSSGVYDYDASWWIVWLTVTNNGGGNDAVELYVYPAWNTDGSASADTSATGSKVVWKAQLFGLQWPVEIGDALIESGNEFIVTSIEADDQFKVAEADGVNGISTPASATLAQGYTAAVEWVAKTAADPMVDKFWRYATYIIGGYKARTVDLEFRSHLSTAASTLSETRTDFDQHNDTKLLRVLAPTDHARTAVLLPKCTITQALMGFRLSGLRLSYTDMSERVHDA